MAGMRQTMRLLQRLQQRAAGASVQAGAAQQAPPARGLQQAASWGSSSSSSSTVALLQQQDAGAARAGAVPSMRRLLSTSSPSLAQASLTEVPVEGSVESVLAEIDRVVTSEAVSAKEVADAAVALAYLQAKGNRRLWGKVFEKAGAVKATFDAASLSNFMWAATTAGVGHFKTLFELSGPAAALIKTLSPTQLSTVVEALGAAGTKDVEFFGLVASQVSSSMASYKPADLARIVWGFGAAGVEDPAFVKAAAKALADKSGELGGREAVQAIWGLARLRTADKPALDALVNAAKSKLDAGVDAAALAWSLGFLNYKADAATAKALASAAQAAAPSLTPAHAVDAAWGLGVMGAGTKETVGPLFAATASAIESAPDALDPYQVAALFEAAAMTPAAALPTKVAAYAAKMYALAGESVKSKQPAALAAFREELAVAAARGTGARYNPEVAAARKNFAVVTPDGVAVDIAVTLDANTKVAIEPVAAELLSSAGTPLGPAAARAKVLESKGFKPVMVSAQEWARLADTKAQTKHLLAAVQAAVPAAAGKIKTLMAKVDEPFDPYQ